MRYVVAVAVAVVVASGCNNHVATPDAAAPCGTSGPQLPNCVAHGLASVQLTGTWSFTGTEVTTPVMPPGPTTTSAASYQIGFTVAGCTLGGESSSYVDDTNAGAPQLMEPGAAGLNGRAYGPAVICSRGDGTLAFHWSKTDVEGTNETTYDDTGTLTRIGP